MGFAVSIFFMKPSPASSQKLAIRLKGASRKLRKNHDVLCLNSAARIQETESLALPWVTEVYFFRENRRV